METRTKALVAGNAEFIGSHIFDRLITDGLDAVVVDHMPSLTRIILKKQNSMKWISRPRDWNLYS